MSALMVIKPYNCSIRAWTLPESVDPFGSILVRSSLTGQWNLEVAIALLQKYALL